ncbi:3'-5' exonuclease [Curvularia kusanoi]|uniref:RNA exonuclease 4 n=1 Tax=Curvularia kusanoi TaxID=90978 RepID=A0A9P4WBF1_CURKU|nr:3'-5' exonuclease [Curvularia kusanoi]
MAPELSSNWKRLQAQLQASKPASSAKPKPSSEQEQETSLKRKRSSKSSEKPTNASRPSFSLTGKTTPHKSPVSRKRQKMEEPASVGASIKQHNVKTLSRSVSTPQLKRTPLATSEADAAVADDILTPYPDFPDVENEGVSETALPGKYVALDCEMVGVGPEPNRDSALARVSLVNYHGHQVYDSYVQMPPKVEVTDYRTAVSGIEPKHLRKDVARTFEEVRSDLKILLGGRILVGHAVKNDLDVLILKHDKRLIRDTSKFSKFRQLATKAGWTPGLKMLTQKLLGVEIQTGAHSSVEDARATMALFRLEKEEFENEIRQKYGNVRMPTAAAEVDGDGEGEEKKKRNRKKSKKKRKH